VRKKELEMRLQALPDFPDPRPELEQYRTPPDIAAWVLHHAWMQGHVESKRVTDLGCGTGTFAVGAYLLGAREVTGVDISESAVSAAERYASSSGMDIHWVVSHVSDFRGTADTVFQNPPFGCQVRGADRPFIKKALECAPVVYSIHHADGAEFAMRLAQSLNAESSLLRTFSYYIPRTYRFHRMERRKFTAAVLMFVRN